MTELVSSENDLPHWYGKRLYEMTVPEMRAAAAHYESIGNEMWANLCREQINLHYQIAEAFHRSCQRGL